MTINNVLVKLSVHNQGINKQLATVIRTTRGFEILTQSDIRKPDILIFELTENIDKEIDFVQSLLLKNEVKDIFLTSETSDSGTLMKALRIGVKEFLPQPIDLDDFKKALYRWESQKKADNSAVLNKNSHIITTFGSKGGVGTTTIAVNLAVSLAKNDLAPKVCLIDMNTLFGEIPLFLEILPKFHWGEITKNMDRLDNTFLSNIISKHESGIHILPSPAYLNGHIRPTPEMVSSVLDLMKGMYDFIIIDGGQSTDDAILRIVEKSDTLILVSILSLPCLTNTNKLIRSFTDLGYLSIDRIKIVINRYLKKSDISLKDAKKGIGNDLFWVIPNDYQSTMSAINKGKPLLNIAPKANISINFMEFAKSIIAPQTDMQQKKRFKFF